jgi:hypothetical protein
MAKLANSESLLQIIAIVFVSDPSIISVAYNYY